jgi:predicted alpha/beta-fold hydrolase
VTVVVTDEGGHCAFVERATPDYDGYWAEREIVRFANAAEASDVRVRLYPYMEPAAG